ncbi:MAG: radical SAM protein [Alcanivoracaceae bacterium]
MERIRTDTWTLTPLGDKRGYIETATLKELWFHTGTACNLACPFCLEGSKPGDDRLDLMTLDDVMPLVDEACELGVRQFSFTGGEPFVAKQFPRILAYAAARRPCLVLTNGTRPLLQRMDEVAALAEAAQPVSFRVSIDYPDPLRHEAARGVGTFAESLIALKQLHEAGFAVSVARQWSVDEDTAVVEQAYRDVFAAHGVPATLRLVSFPDFAPPGVERETPYITESCMTTYHSAETRAAFMCAFSRMVVKDRGRMRVYACTLVDDDPSYDLGGTLRESLGERIMMKHHRCFTCFKHGASCSEL